MQNVYYHFHSLSLSLSSTLFSLFPPTHNSEFNLQSLHFEKSGRFFCRRNSHIISSSYSRFFSSFSPENSSFSPENSSLQLKISSPFLLKLEILQKRRKILSSILEFCFIFKGKCRVENSRKNSRRCQNSSWRRGGH